MLKLSPLNLHINNAPIVITIEEVNLGNSSNESILYRAHQFTVIRPDLMGMANTAQMIDKKAKNAGEGMKGKLKNMLSKTKPVVNLKSFIELKLIPNFVLINPDDWGGIAIKDKTGTITNIPLSGDVLITLHKFIGNTDDDTMSVNFKIKESNV